MVVADEATSASFAPASVSPSPSSSTAPTCLNNTGLHARVRRSSRHRLDLRRIAFSATAVSSLHDPPRILLNSPSTYVLDRQSNHDLLLTRHTSQDRRSRLPGHVRLPAWRGRRQLFAGRPQ